MIISVCIPCHKAHIPQLKQIIEDLLRQTRKPNEIIAYIKPIKKNEIINVNKEVTEVFNSCNNKDNKTSLTLLFSHQHSSMGFAKNRCLERAVGDIIITADCDDRIHTQKVEIVENFFKKNEDCDALAHSYVNNNDKILEENIKAKDLTYVRCYDDKNSYGILSKCRTPIHHAHASFKKTVFNKFKFDESQENFGKDDSLMLKQLVNKNYNVYLVKSPLVVFDTNLSEWKK